MQDKINLIVDGNYLINRAAFLLRKYPSTFKTDFPALIRKDFTNIQNLFPFENKYFVCDDKISWRKKIYPEYKANRKVNKTEDIDWDFVNFAYDEFKEELKNKKNIDFRFSPYCEGDDHITHIVKTSNKKAYSNFVVSVDGDLHQLLDYNIYQKWINVQYNYKMSDPFLYVPSNYQIYMKHLEMNSDKDLFDLTEGESYFEFLTRLVKSVKLEEKNKEESLFVKLIKGDTGDNIPSIYIETGTTGKPRGIGDKGAETVYKLYKETYPENIDFYKIDLLFERVPELIGYYRKFNTASNKLELYESIKTDLKRNLILIHLDESRLPNKIYENLYNNEFSF